jgi:hypothetical protein
MDTTEPAPTRKLPLHRRETGGLTPEQLALLETPVAKRTAAQAFAKIFRSRISGSSRECSELPTDPTRFILNQSPKWN